jgi:plasmid stabilisation system protein
MVKYRVDITDEALGDMESIYEYIAFKLLAPENAMGQYNRIADVLFNSIRSY